MNAVSTSIGSFLKPAVGTVPAAVAAGTRNGFSIDRTGFDSCVLFVQGGAVAGAPSAQSLVSKLQESDDGSTWTDISGAAIAAITSASSSAKVNVSLATAKQYVRVVETVAFTGGTNPLMGAASAVVLGGASLLPAV